jgi:hypothetical protein
MRETLVFVVCPGHSGSTLLGHFLGAHPSIVHIGEVVAPMRRNRPFRCRFCEHAPCPVWGSALIEPDVRAALAQFGSERLIPAPLDRWRRWLGVADRRASLHAKVFDAVPGTDVVVDSSKTLGWAEWNRRGAAPRRVVLLQLRRDLRGVLASHLRRNDPDPVERIARNLVHSTRRILAALARVDPADTASFRYEDLVSDPEATGHALCRLLGLEFDPAMLRYYEVPQHVIGGNPGPTYQVRAHHGRSDGTSELLDATSPENQAFYRNRPPGFISDERWKQELDAETLARFDAIAGPTNRSLGYEDSPESARTKSTST